MTTTLSKIHEGPTKRIGVSPKTRSKFNNVDLLLLNNFQEQTRTIQTLKRSFVVEYNASTEQGKGYPFSEKEALNQSIDNCDSALYFLNEAIALLVSKYES